MFVDSFCADVFALESSRLIIPIDFGEPRLYDRAKSWMKFEAKQPESKVWTDIDRGIVIGFSGGAVISTGALDPVYVDIRRLLADNQREFLVLIYG